jgi:uncharacterized membrane protein YhhN
MKFKKIGGWSFIVGLIIVLLIGLVPKIMGSNWWPIVLIILGVIVGFLNIQEKEVTKFLVATMAIIISSGILGALGQRLASAGNALIIFTAGAAIVVSIKAIISTGKN